MQIGKLKEENNSLLESYKNFGFSNKTKMLDYALDLLRERIKKKKRRRAKERMLQLYSHSPLETSFSNIEGEDFE